LWLYHYFTWILVYLRLIHISNNRFKMKLSFFPFFLFALLLSVTLSCKKNSSDFIANIDSHDTDRFIEIPRTDGRYIIKLYSEKIIETSFIPKGETFNPTSHAVVLQTKGIQAQVSETDNSVIYGSNGIKVHITKEPFHISYTYKGKELISENKGYTKTDSTEILDFNLDKDEVIYGAGARRIMDTRRARSL